MNTGPYGNYEFRVLECAHTSVYAWGIYDASITHFGEPTEASSLTSRAWAYEVLLGGFVTFAVQVRDIGRPALNSRTNIFAGVLCSPAIHPYKTTMASMDVLGS